MQNRLVCKTVIYIVLDTRWREFIRKEIEGTRTKIEATESQEIICKIIMMHSGHGHGNAHVANSNVCMLHSHTCKSQHQQPLYVHVNTAQNTYSVHTGAERATRT